MSYTKIAKTNTKDLISAYKLAQLSYIMFGISIAVEIHRKCWIISEYPFTFGFNKLMRQCKSSITAKVINIVLLH